jgi:large subunit ribosomal protein L7/L12
MFVFKDDILEVISNMTVVEVVDLIEAMEEKFGVIVAAPVAVAAVGGVDAGGAAAEEQSEFDVVMISFGDNKVGVIKVVCGIIGFGFKEAKAMVEGVPATVKEGVEKAEAEDVVK